MQATAVCQLVLYICYIHSVDPGRVGMGLFLFLKRHFVHFFECFAELFIFILCEEFFMLRVVQAKESCN